MIITIAIIVVTAIVSIRAFSDRELFAKLLLNPYQVYHRKQYYRMLGHGFLHADYTHLIFNMLALWFFGGNVEGIMGIPWYLALYFGGMVFASLTSVFKHKDNYVFNSVGASGAVSAVVFASILFNPKQGIGLLFLPGLYIPGILFGILFLIYSQYMSKRNHDNINHDAHFMGALFGFTFPILIDQDYFMGFIDAIFNWMAH